MTDAVRRKLRIPNWYPPYLERNRIHDLFHELAWELVIRQPNDHILYLKNLLLHSMSRKDSIRVILLSPSQVNICIVAQRLSKETGAEIISYKDVQHGVKGEFTSIKHFIHCLNKFLSNEVYRNGWILYDIPKNVQQARAMQAIGILPTHVFQLVPPFSPLLYELNIKNTSAIWMHYRRNILGLREVYKHSLKEILIEEKNSSEVAEKCLQLLRIKRRYKAPIIPKICILGCPGSGCKTQAKLLATKFNLIYIDFVYIFLQELNANTYLNKLLLAARDKIADFSILLTAVVHKRILQRDCLENGFVLVGFPNTLNDMKNLDMIDTPINRIIFLDVNLNICRCRLKNLHTTNPDGDISINILYFKTMFPISYSHNMAKEDMINCQINYFCQHYNQLRKYCGLSSNLINGNQSIQRVAECINSIIMGPIGSSECRRAECCDEFDSFQPPSSRT